jgi:hemerythrin-like metal-binding protein
MSKLAWKDSYSVGVAELDEQHRELLKLLNTLIEQPAGHAHERSFFTTLNALVLYAEKHFATEESYMARCEYPDLKNHQEEHVTFTASVFALRERLERRERDMQSTLVNFVKDWYISHVLGTDRGYVRLFAERGIR